MEKLTLVFSDLHLKPETSDLVFNKVLPEISKVCKERKINTIICLGDVWDIRYKVPVVEQNLLDKWLCKCAKSKIKVHLLPGNHDEVDVDGSNALEIFNNIPNVVVYSHPAINELGGFIPYRKNINSFLEAVEMMKANKVKRVFIHQDIVGALMNQKYISEGGVDASIFDSFDIVLSGHFHIPSIIGKNTHYVGSLYPTKRDEILNSNRFILLNEDNCVQSIGVNFGHIFNDITVAPPKNISVESRLNTSDNASIEEYAGLYLLSKVTDSSKLTKYKNIFSKVTGYAIH